MLNSGSRSIIEDILLWCYHEESLIVYFECVCKVFFKYRCSFNLAKCVFLLDRLEYVGHDILKDGTTLARSKFNMINDWKLPISGQNLFSFIGLVTFYHIFAPFMRSALNRYKT